MNDTETDLRALDEEIARLRGWVVVTVPFVSAWPRRWKAADGSGERDCDTECLPLYTDDPPPFSSDWALAGPLLVEMGGAVSPHEDDGWIAGQDFLIGSRGATPTEAIARAWLVWRCRDHPRVAIP